MRHDLYQTFDSENAPMYVCLACKAVFSAHTPIDLLDASACGGSMGAPLRFTFEVDSAAVDRLLNRLSVDDITRKGTTLIDAWQKGRDIL